MDRNNNITIDQNKCINCGICVQACPVKVFEKSSDMIEIIQQHLRFCIDCGDCISVCPKEAVTGCSQMVEEFDHSTVSLNQEQFYAFLKERRSIRSYKPVSLSQSEKEYLQRVASLAPRGGHTLSARNTGIVIIDDKELINQIINYTYNYINMLKRKLTSFWIGIPALFNTGLRNNINNTIKQIDLILQAKENNINMLTYDCPNLFLLHCQKDSPVSKENLTVMEYQLMLGAQALNLGTCFLGWMSFAMQSFMIKKTNELEKLYDILGITKDREILGVFSIGQKRSKYIKLKSRK